MLNPLLCVVNQRQSEGSTASLAWADVTFLMPGQDSLSMGVRHPDFLVCRSAQPVLEGAIH